MTGIGTKKAKAIPLSAVPRKWAAEVDIVVVGLGGSGAAASIEAHDARAKVLILEKRPVAGGSSTLSGGVVYAAGTSIQRAAGIIDSADEMYKYWMAMSIGLTDPEKARLLSDKSAETVEWLTDLGVEFPQKDLYVSGSEKKFEHITPAKKRGHRAKSGGAAYMKKLVDAVNARGIEVMFETSLKELISTPEREVLGVKAESKEKTLYIKTRKGVVLTTGGFCGSKELLEDYIPEGKYYGPPLGNPGNTGDGIRLAQSIGADTLHMWNGTATCGVVIPGLDKMVLNALPFRYYLDLCCIMVNKEGKRFVNEISRLPPSPTTEVVKQTDGVVYTIFDEATRKKLKVSREKKI